VETLRPRFAFAYRKVRRAPTPSTEARGQSESTAVVAAFQIQEISMKPENRIEKFSTHWQSNFEKEPYYSDRYSWDDYDPAYRYAYKSYEENPHARFEDLETRLEAGWDIAKGKSKLAWVDAKQAIRSAWNNLTS